MLHRCGDGGVNASDAIGEIAGRFDGLVERFGGHRLFSRAGAWESVSTRRVWRSPATSGVRNVVMHAVVISMPVSLAPSATTFASLSSRASLDDSVSATGAHRHA